MGAQVPDLFEDDKRTEQFFCPEWIQISPPCASDPARWGATNLLRSRDYFLSREAACILFFFVERSSVAHAVESLSEKLSCSQDLISIIIETLCACDLLIDSCKIDTRREALLRDRPHWIRCGWLSSWSYLFSCYDYAFVDASVEGRRDDADRMKGYAKQAADNFRAKSYPACESFSISPSKNFDACNIAVEEKLGFSQNLIDAIYLTFCKIGEIKVPWSDIPMFRRTSPSGGARHPSEAYIIKFSHGGQDQAIYHLNAIMPSLELLISSKNHEPDLRIIFRSAMERCGFIPDGAIVLTTIFEKNIYRYRESRTYRSVHMDIGHLISTFSHVANSRRMAIFPYYTFDFSGFSKIIALDPFSEGSQACILYQEAIDERE